MSGIDWWDDLSEGLVLIEGNRVRGVNAAAARMLKIEQRWAEGKELFLVLRNHHLDNVWRDGGEAEIKLGESDIIASRISAGLLLRDVTNERKAATTARELLAVISHELRTPMTTVTSTLEALEYGDLEEGLRGRFVERARTEAERVVRLLADLTVSVDPPRERTVDIAEILNRAESLLRTTLDERGTRLVPALKGRTVWADPDKLLQVILNLVENAATHGPEGGVVEVSAEETTDGWLELCVSDSGEPLPREVEARLFKPYSGSGRGRARGLGLYIVKAIVERSGGQTWYSRWTDDAGGSGNRFHALLPVRRPGL